MSTVVFMECAECGQSRPHGVTVCPTCRTTRVVPRWLCGDAVVRKFSDRKRRKLAQLIGTIDRDGKFCTDPIRLLDSRGRIWTVPILRISDAGSIPWLVQPLAGSPWDGLRSFFLHDDLYLRQCDDEGNPVSRLEADEVLRDGLIAEGSSELRASVVYRGVRVGGWHAWNNHAERKVKLSSVAGLRWEGVNVTAEA